jgi:uncharacterized membrane protein YphA (DoxX/SURF4 family)
VRRLFFAFPTGLPGIGLIVLRITVAAGAIAQGIGSLAGSSQLTLAEQAIDVFAIVAALVLLIGLMTPIASLALASGYLGAGVSSFLSPDIVKHSNSFTALSLAAISTALVLLGPGAISFDARLFGRREIVIPQDSRSLDE